MSEHKERITTLLTAGLCGALLAAAAFAEWPQAGGGLNDDRVTRMVTSATGQTYVLGSFRGTATFGTHEVTSAGSDDLFIARYDQSGEVLWVRSAGGGALDEGLDLAVDESDNVYVVGYFHGTAGFGSFQETAEDDDADAFVAKLDKDGFWKWVRPIPGDGDEKAYSVAVTPADNQTLPPTPGSVFVAGGYRWNVRFEHPDPQDPTSTVIKKTFDNSRNLALSKTATASDALPNDPPDHAVDGDIQTEWWGMATLGGFHFAYYAWFKVDLGESYDIGRIVVDWSSGGRPWNCYLSVSDDDDSWTLFSYCGTSADRQEINGSGFGRYVKYEGSGAQYALIGLTEFEVYEPTQASDVFVARLNTDGEFIWAIDGGNGPTGDEYATRLAVNDAGNLIVAGQFLRSSSLGGRPLTHSGSGPNYFVARIVNAMTPSPSFAWAMKLDDDVAHVADLVIDDGGSIFLLANATGPTTWGSSTLSPGTLPYSAVTRLEDLGSTGHWSWAQKLAEGGTVGGGGLALDDAGDVYVAGSQAGSGGSQDVFVGKYGGSAGLLQWDEPLVAGGPEEDLGLAVSFGAGGLYLGGSFRGTATFGDDSIMSSGGTDAFVANLDPYYGTWFTVESWVAGQVIDPPGGADVTHGAVSCMPEIFVADQQVLDGIPRLFFWSYEPGTGGRLHAVQPVDNVEIRWHVEGNGCDRTRPERRVSRGSTLWPDTPCPSADPEAPACAQIHVATAPVEVEIAGKTLLSAPTIPDAGGSDAKINQGIFTAGEPGYSILVYFDGPQPNHLTYYAELEVVKTVRYRDAPRFTSGAACTIGEEIAPPTFHDQAGRAGYVLKERAFYDGAGADAAYNRAARTGQILAVNQVNPNLSDGEDLMAVAWYHRSDRGVYWPEMPIVYDCRWPAVNDKIVIASQLGSEVLGQAVLAPQQFPERRIYQQPDRTMPGFNPNDEHAMFAPSATGSGVEAIFALRSDFALAPSHTASSEPYVLLKYREPATGAWAFKIYQVLGTGAGFNDFRFNGTAATPIYPPYPLSILQTCPQTLVAGQSEQGDPVPPPFHKDHKSQVWGKSAGTGSVHYHYPLQPGFFYDLDGDGLMDDLNGNGTLGDEDGECVPFLARLPVDLGGTPGTEDPIDVTYEITWPTEVPVLTIGETLLTPKAGLPDVFNQAAVTVIYDELQETQPAGHEDPTRTLVRLVDPLSPRTVSLGSLPAEIATRTDLATGKKLISGSADGKLRLPTEVRWRIAYDEQNKKLEWSGVFNEVGAGEPMLLLNVMTDRERRLLKELYNGDGGGAEDYTGECQATEQPEQDCSGGDPAKCKCQPKIEVDSHCNWEQAIEALYHLTRNPNRVDLDDDKVPDHDLLVGLEKNCESGTAEPAPVVGFQPALTAGFAQGHGFVTLAFNDDESLGALPVSLKVIRVDCLRSPPDCTGAACDVLATYQGEVDVLESDNVFDEQLTLRHSGDFAGRSADVRFEWYYHPDLDGTPPMPLPDPEGGQLHGWLKFSPPDGDPGAHSISIKGANLLTLSDNWYVVRYQLPPAAGPDGIPDTGDDAPLCSSGFGLWTGQPGSTPANPRAMLAEGWIKRVIKGLNPFETRVKDFHAAPTQTFASMIGQLGERYEGDIAFNPDPNNLQKVGLIEAYETVQRRGMTLSVDATPPINYGPANNAVLLVTSRISDFYTLLGNEAYADAQDPTVGITTDEVQFGIGSLAPTIFNFQNQLASLLEEELVLLRGRDDSQGPTAARPVYNRLFWNFTTGQGEVAYALSYNVTDQDLDGLIDETDAQILFPQGHGDAWGHYLTAMTTYYKLLRHPFFTWVPRPEAILVAGVPIQVDFLDERKFAKAAAAKARVGSELVDLTYRLNYVEDPGGQWQGYKDTDPDRAWGLSGWARRAGQGAYLDWVVGNSLLPDEDPNPDHFGIQKIDRQTVDELDEVASFYDEIQIQLDEADRGLNPLGLAKGVVPFDVDPARVDQGETHFEQVLVRAEQALANTVDVWDFANQLTRMLRRSQDSVDDMALNQQATEIDFNNRLIEVFGYPYSDDIGPGGTYPAAYDGPDLYHYMIVDTPALTGTALDIDDLVPAQIGRVRSFNAKYKPMGNGVNWFDIAQEDSFGFFNCADAPIGPGCSLGSSPSDEDLEVEYTTWESDIGILFTTNKDWTGTRRATGKIQDALYETLQAQTALKKALADYNRLKLDIEGAARTFRAGFNVANEKLRIKNVQRSTVFGINTTLDIMNSVLIYSTEVKTVVDKSFEISQRCISGNVVVGLAAGGDLFSGVHCAMKATQAATTKVIGHVQAGLKIADLALKRAKEEVGFTTALKLEVLGAELDQYKANSQVNALIRQEPVLRAEVYARCQDVEQAHQKYVNALAEGQRILAQLINYRKNGAAAVQEYRYQDMAFRIFRNDALQKYRAQFDLAARYAYLAAAAYDYDTNLLHTDSRAGQDFLTDIVRERSLGQILDGEPVPGSRGLADPIGRMKANFEVLKGQMGFNNPQIETNRFSLRRELFRIADGPEGDQKWRDKLEEHRVGNLWDVEEFRRFARPFAAEELGPQPALVIPFSTTVTFGQNFFGWPLGAGDSFYDSSSFATRIRGVGVWLDAYGQLPLTQTPRLYFFPIGADVLRAPSAGDFKTREWAVVDQLLPVPFPIADGDLTDPHWIPLVDSLSGSFDEIRRFASFRAYDYQDALNDSEIVSDSRLIGRSVWNTNWVLVIPGGTLLYNADEGLDTLIFGQEIPGGEGERDGNGVKDILFFFKTYAYSGF